MKDFLDNVIEVGDTVVAAQGHGRNSGASLVKFVVDGFTPTMVKGTIPVCYGYPGQFCQTKITPKKCLVIQKKVLDPADKIV